MNLKEPNMATNSAPTSAKIYAFPARGRFVAGNRQEKPAELTSAPAVKVAVGSGWYHEAAIQEAEQARKS
jgi:hypothetical protein